MTAGIKTVDADAAGERQKGAGCTGEKPANKYIASYAAVFS